MNERRATAEREARTTKSRERPRIVGKEEQPKRTSAREGPGLEVGKGRGDAAGKASRVSGMDIRREPRSKRKRYIYAGFGVAALILITWGLSRLEPAAPTVDRNIIVLGAVERGDMVREVRGSGTLVPERVQFVAALTAGRVESVHFEPGEWVGADDVILVLSNPDIELQVLQAQQQWTGARANLVSLRQTLGSARLAQEAAVATAQADYMESERQAQAFQELYEDGRGVSENEYRTAIENAEALQTRLRTEEQRLDLLNSTIDEQFEVQRQQVVRLGAIFRYQQERAASMQVTAGAEGVLQDLDLEVGQWVQAGTTLARVAKPERLKAELRIPQTQARDVQVGQSALIDTRTDSIPGRVRRVDPNVQGGSVLVEITLDGDLPTGARPDLSVDGTIQLERLEEVLHVGRPVYGQSNATVSIFRLIEDGGAAERITVRLGRASVNEIEVVEGLAVGDAIILSDMSRYDDVERVRIRN